MKGTELNSSPKVKDELGLVKLPARFKSQPRTRKKQHTPVLIRVESKTDHSNPTPMGTEPLRDSTQLEDIHQPVLEPTVKLVKKRPAKLASPMIRLAEKVYITERTEKTPIRDVPRKIQLIREQKWDMRHSMIETTALRSVRTGKPIKVIQ